MFRIPSLHRSIRVVCLMVCVLFFYSPVQLVSASPPVQGSDITLTADQTNLTQGQCTTLHEFIPEGWSLVQPLGMMWLADGCRGATIQDSLEVCPTTTTTYTIYANYCDGTKQASVTISVSSPPPAQPSSVPVQPPVNSLTDTQAQISNEIYYAALRRSPGYSNKNNDVDLLANVPAGDIIQVLGGPEQADGLNWWYVSWNGQTGWMSDHTGSGKTIMIFLSSASVPTPVPPTRTPIPPSATPIPSTKTRVPPSATAIPPTQKPISTLIVPPPATQSNALELSVVPITQRVKDNPITLSNGMTDNGDHDCFIASMSMALEYLKSQNILDNNDTTNYRSLVPIVRKTTPQDIDLSVDPAFVSDVTNKKLSARWWMTPPENLSVAIEIELKAGRPVVAAASNGNLLAAKWTGMAGHSVFIYGLHDGRVYYVDPWDGNRYDMSIQDFVKADTWKDGSLLITFERLQQ
jgi:hypothetical protein